MMNNVTGILILALGVFVGNWLVSPAVVSGRTLWDGFWIGIIAACLVLLVGGIYLKFFAN